MRVLTEEESFKRGCWAIPEAQDISRNITSRILRMILILFFNIIIIILIASNGFKAVKDTGTVSFFNQTKILEREGYKKDNIKYAGKYSKDGSDDAGSGPHTVCGKKSS